MKPVNNSTAKTFQATLEPGDSRLKWVIVRIPFDVPETWKIQGRFRVKGEINGFAFRTSLFPAGDGNHTLLVNKRMQACAKARVGSIAKFRLEPDTEERVAAVPAELKLALSEDRSLRRWFDRLNYSTRKEIADWITDVKSDEARAGRAGQIAERLLATMEAELDLPPILRVAFARDPRAEQGWNLMTPLRRRGHLLGIFYYQNPASRARRLAKALQDAHAVADKRLP